ncbi:MAG: TolC family protein [Vicinamibacterales bacterium]
MLVIAPLRAQPSSQALTLDAAIERALAANPSLLASRAGRAVADAGLGVAAERPNPEVIYEAEREAPRQAIGVSLPIELGGKRGRRLSLARASVASTEAGIARTISMIRSAVRLAYFELAAANQRTAMADDVRGLAVRARDAAQARFLAGDVPRLDLLQTELALADVESDRAAARGEAQALAAELNALLGEPIATPVSLADSLVAAPMPALEDVITSATRSNADIVVLDRRIEEQIARRSLADALRKPDLTAGGSITYDAQPEFSVGWRANVAITLPLFSTHRAAVLVEDAELHRLQSERAAQLATTTGAVTAAHTRAEAARDQVARFDTEILPRALEVEQMAQDGYSAGQTGLPQYITALQQGSDIRRRRLDAALAYQRALAELERAMGVPLR